MVRLLIGLYASCITLALTLPFWNDHPYLFFPTLLLMSWLTMKFATWGQRVS